MNKVMNNFKRLGNSTLNEIENENVKILDHLKIQKGQFLLPFFFTLNKIRTLGMKVLGVFFIKNYCNVCRMNLKKNFQKVILIDLTLMILLAIGFFYQSETILAFNESMNPSNNLNDMLLGVIALIFLILYLVNLYLLYKFKNLGKQMYLFIFIMGIVISLLSGTNASGPVMYTIDGLGWSISGVILGFLYFSPIKKEFEK
jgi:hypothetical protein